jgi:PASTA domain
VRLRRGVCGALLVALACGLLSASSAGATTVTVGQLFTPMSGCGGATFLQTGMASGTSYTVPTAGVITSWSFEDGASAVSGLKLKVGRSATVGNYTIVADAAAGTQVANTVNTYSAHIPVKAGDLIGLFATGSGPCASVTGNAADTLVSAFGDQSPGTTTSYMSAANFKFPISVKVAVCVVPKLKGKTLSAAKDALADASCALGKVTKKESSGKPGIVLSQKPKAGTEPPGPKVAVVVSTT